MQKETNQKIALISMRSDFIASRKERRDSIDENIYKMIHDLGFTPLLIANDLVAVSNFLSKIIDFLHFNQFSLFKGNMTTSGSEYLVGCYQLQALKL